MYKVKNGRWECQSRVDNQIMKIAILLARELEEMQKSATKQSELRAKNEEMKYQLKVQFHFPHHCRQGL